MATVALGKIRTVAIAAVVTGLWLITGTTAPAAITFYGASGNLSASATFSVNGSGNLVVSLANTYTGDTANQSGVLTALYFSGADGLGEVSATAPAGSTFWRGAGGSTLTSLPVPNATPGPDGTILAQQWEYLSGISGMTGVPSGATAGISSSGFGIFGSGNFAGGGAMLDGSSYGLLSAGYAGAGNDGLKGSSGSPNYYIQNSMTFELSGFSGNLSNITNVVFQYGTTTSEPSFVGTVVPEPNFGAIAAMILLAFACSEWMKQSKSRRQPVAQAGCRLPN
jgi:autotransporter-associated beta strand protein